MTEKELFRNAMKENMRNPAEQSAAEVRESKRKYGYVRSSAAKYVAAAAALVIAVGAGAAVYLSRRETVDKDVGSAGPESIAAADVSADSTVSAAETPAESNVSKAEQPADPEEAMAVEVYNRFWNEVASNPGKYWSLFSADEFGNIFYDGKTEHHSLWFAEDQIDQPKSGHNLSQDLAAFFSDSEKAKAEFIGYYAKAKDSSRAIPKEIYESLMYSEYDISLATRSAVVQRDLSGIYADYTVKDGIGYVRIKSNLNREEKGFDFVYKVTAANGDLPLLEENSFSVPEDFDWNTGESYGDYLITKEELQAQDTSKVYRFTDAESRISYSVSLDFNGNMPVVHIRDIELPEGVDFTEGEFEIYLDTADRFADSSAVVHPVAINESLWADGKGAADVDLKDYAGRVTKEDIVSVRVNAHFNTTEHSAAVHKNFGKEYAYSILGYIGIDRRPQPDIINQ